MERGMGIFRINKKKEGYRGTQYDIRIRNIFLFKIKLISWTNER